MTRSSGASTPPVNGSVDRIVSPIPNCVVSPEVVRLIVLPSTGVALASSRSGSLSVPCVENGTAPETSSVPGSSAPLPGV